MTSFDPKSGVVFREATSAPSKSMLSAWESQHAGRSGRETFFKSRGKGCDTLQKMALRACVWNVDSFLPETLQWAGWMYAGKIWKACKDMKGVSFKGWVLFMKTFPEEIDQLQKFRFRQKDIPNELPSIVGRLRSLDVNALVMLSVSDMNVDCEQLISLSTIPMLGALSIKWQLSHRDESGRQRLLKHWVRAVQESQGFKQLKVLVLAQSGFTLEDTINHVSGFPALSLIGYRNLENVVDSGGNAISNKSGQWVPYPFNQPHGDLQVSSGARHDEGVPGELIDRSTFLCLEDPDRIWKSTSFTLIEKLHKLYQISQELHEPGQPLQSRNAVGISYSNNAQFDTSDITRWYCRDPARQVDGDPDMACRLVEKEKEPPQKKRKIRGGKQQDISAFLGSFN